jgi:hypothetical protein
LSFLVNRRRRRPLLPRSKEVVSIPSLAFLRCLFVSLLALFLSRTSGYYDAMTKGKGLLRMC